MNYITRKTAIELAGPHGINEEESQRFGVDDVELLCNAAIKHYLEAQPAKPIPVGADGLPDVAETEAAMDALAKAARIPPYTHLQSIIKSNVAKREQPAEPESSLWIPVTERLPPRVQGGPCSERVLVIRPHGHVEIDQASYEHQHKDFDYGGPKVPCFDGWGATHWQPLPEGLAAKGTSMTHEHELISRLQSLLQRMSNDERTSTMFEADGDTLRDAMDYIRKAALAQQAKPELTNDEMWKVWDDYYGAIPSYDRPAFEPCLYANMLAAAAKGRT